MLLAVTPCDRLLLDRANNLFNRRADPINETYDAVAIDDMHDIVDGLKRIVTIYTDWLAPAGETAILEMLADFADMLQCAAPNAKGISLYVDAMNLPLNLMPIAKRKVAASHRFARLPLPRDFLAAIEAEMAWCLRKQSWVALLAGHFERALNKRINNRRM